MDPVASLRWWPGARFAAPVVCWQAEGYDPVLFCSAVRMLATKILISSSFSCSTRLSCSLGSMSGACWISRSHLCVSLNSFAQYAVCEQSPSGIRPPALRHDWDAETSQLSIVVRRHGYRSSCSVTAPQSASLAARTPAIDPGDHTSGYSSPLRLASNPATLLPDPVLSIPPLISKSLRSSRCYTNSSIFAISPQIAPRPPSQRRHTIHPPPPLRCWMFDVECSMFCRKSRPRPPSQRRLRIHPPPSFDVGRSMLDVRCSAANRAPGHHLNTPHDPPASLLRCWMFVLMFDVLPQSAPQATISITSHDPHRHLGAESAGEPVGYVGSSAFPGPGHRDG